VLNDMFRMYVPDESVEEQWDIAGPKRAQGRFKLELPLRRWLEANRSAGRDPARRIVEKAQAGYAAKLPAGAETSFRLRALRHAADPRRGTGASTSPLDHLRPNPSARLRAEKPEAGIQARGIRAVRRHDRGGPSSRSSSR